MPVPVFVLRVRRHCLRSLPLVTSPKLDDLARKRDWKGTFGEGGGESVISGLGVEAGEAKRQLDSRSLAAYTIE